MFWRALLLAAALCSPFVPAIAAPPMPPIVVLIVCKVKPASGPNDINSAQTHHENLEWDTTHAQMRCRRIQLQVTDAAADQGADPQPYNEWRCQRSAALLGPLWDAQHHSSSYRFWRSACPVPIVHATPDGQRHIVGWKIPDCGGYRGAIICDIDIEI